MFKRNCKIFSVFCSILVATLSGNAQTFFETAKDDAVIVFSEKNVSQIKLNLASTAISFGYNFRSGKAVNRLQFILNGEIKVKPNDDGIATLIKNGDIQPGLKANASVGVRLNDPFDKLFSVFDFYLKPSYQLNGFSIYDTTRIPSGLDPYYKTNKSSFALNALLNGCISPGTFNIFFGLQYGSNWTNNGEDIDKATIQTISPYPGSTSQYILSNTKEVKLGPLLNVEKHPLKIDLIVDPNIPIKKITKSNINLGFFGYFRNDGKLKKYRQGFGLCFLDRLNPSKIFASIGYEMPTTGEDVTPTARKKDKGQVFLSIGYSIFK